jgi:serine protease Do
MRTDHIRALLNEVKSMSNQPLGRRLAGALAVAFLLSACSPGASTAANAQAGQAAEPGVPVAKPAPASPNADAPLVRALPDFTALVERYGPAVVNVEAVGRRQSVGGIPGLSPDDPFYEFFRRFGPNAPRGNVPTPRGQGSGFIVSPDGYILTNAHVVNDASEVNVKLTDRREYTAKVVGIDERTDVAVLKIDAKDLPAVQLGDPSSLRPGEWVVAIGSPFGFENSVTAGIVSATSRALGQESSLVPFIQTDVAVNPGNSGGPLFNLSGQVVGINSQIYSRTGGYQGVSFAIPIDVAMNVQQQLIKTGRVVRGRIGVQIQPVNAQLAESFGLDRPRGALVSVVEGGAPADKAGIKAGDVILEVDGRTIENSSELPAVIAAVQPGQNARLQVWRDGKPRRIDVRVGELEERGVVRTAARADEEEAEESSRLGLSVRPLAPQEKQQAQTDGNLVVQGVDGPAANAGVQPGDIIIAVNNTPVKSVEDLRNAARKSGKSVALLIQRDETKIYIPLRVG